jgi:hypothetical protein
LQTPVEEYWSVTIEMVVNTNTVYEIGESKQREKRGRKRMIHPVESAAIPKAKSDDLKFESVADILERDLHAVIQDWLSRVEKESDLTCIQLNFEERRGRQGH